MIEKKEWNDFLINNNGSFSQSWEWGEFKKEEGHRVWRVTVGEEKITSIAQIIEEKLPFNFAYLYVSFGPVIKKDIKDKEEIISSILEKVKEIKEKKHIFIKIESEKGEIKKGVKSFRRIQPKQTIILNIEKEELELLKGFRKVVRYNIKAAKKKGVLIEMINGYDNSFFNLLKKTSKRQYFNVYNEDYYSSLFKQKSEYFNIKMFKALVENEVIAAAIVIFFGKRATYLHACSDYNKKEYSAPNLLNFEAIKQAKKEGCVEYDFWGADAKKMPGVTMFKEGFSKNYIKYPLAKDIILNPFIYLLFRITYKFKNVLKKN